MKKFLISLCLITSFSTCFAQTQKGAEGLIKAARVFQTPDSLAKCSAAFIVAKQNLVQVANLNRSNPEIKSLADNKIKAADAFIELSIEIANHLFIKTKKITEAGMKELLAVNYGKYSAMPLPEITINYNQCADKIEGLFK